MLSVFKWLVLMQMVEYVNPIQDGPFRGCSHISYNDDTWHSYTLPLPKEDQKKYKWLDTPHEFCWHQCFFYISRNTDSRNIDLHFNA